MTAPPAPTPQVRLLRWGILVSALTILIVAGVLVLRSASSAIERFGTPAEPRITQQTVVVERLRDVSKLVATEMTLRDVVIYEQTRFASTKRVLLVVTGKVSAGINMERGTEVSIDSAAKRITISLPPAQIISVDVLNVTTYDESAGLLPFVPVLMLLDRLELRAVERPRRGARSDDVRLALAAAASVAAAKVLTELLTRDGYTVEIVRPGLVGRPAG